MSIAFLMSGVSVLLASYEHRDAFIVGLALLSVLVLSVPVVGAAATAAAPRNPVSWILLAAGTALPLALASYIYSRAVYVLGADLPAAPLAAWLDGWTWIPAILLVPTFGILLFPDGHLPSRGWRALLWLQVALAGALLFSTLFETTALDYPDQENLTALPGAAGEVAYAFGFSIVLVAPLALASAVAFEQRRRRTADAGMRRVLDEVRPAVWLIVGSWVACFVIGMVGGDTLVALPFEAIGMATLGVCCWLAVHRHGLFDARLTLRRGLVYGALTVLIMGVYALLAAALTWGGATQLATPFALAVAVLVAVPLRDTLQRGANRLVFGERADPYETFIHLGEQLEATATSGEVLTETAQVLRSTLRLAYVGIRWDEEHLADAGIATGTDQHVVPLVYAGESVGALLAESGNGSVTSDQRRLLGGVASQIAAAARATALSRALVGSRERLVAATEEERRRLRRDLHDGLGPTLSGAVLGIGRAHSLLTSDPEAAARQLDVLTGQIQDAVSEVRRLVYGLRPPALDELGLIGALDEQAQRLGSTTVRGPTHGMHLGAAVEVAAYRIAMEAMTNAARHARAGAVTVEVSVDDCLRLHITDDGIGLPETYRAGVGIASMRARASELGGLCTIKRGTPRGTLVDATLPLGEP